MSCLLALNTLIKNMQATSSDVSFWALLILASTSTVVWYTFLCLGMAVIVLIQDLRRALYENK